ncbi:MAG TPA: hypothetical protein PK102_11810, partial [bacterium]|nr:hypothetical protein [bacterium]
MKDILISLIFVVLFVVGSCGEDSNKIDQKLEGSEGGPCYGNKTCDDDLVCENGVCVDPEKVTD